MSGFSYKANNDAAYYTIDSFEEAHRVKTCFSTRIGGVSKGPFSCLNLGHKSGDVKENIDRNFDLLCKAAGFNLDDLVLSDQVHEDKCRIVTAKDRGKGIIIESDIQGIDALITNEKNTALCIFTADCVPVFLYDRVYDVIALCHAGWRGVVKGIVPSTIRRMCESFGTIPVDVLAAIGPSIGPCCFNVGTDVVREFKHVFSDISDIIIEKDGRYKINLWNSAYIQLKNAGLKDSNITNSRLCTSCSKDEFYSYRRDGSSTGRMVSILQLL